MIKNVFKKVMACALAFSAVCMTATGCKKDKTDYDPNNFLPNGTADNPYQIVNEPVTLRIFVPRHASHKHYNEMVLFKELSRITNLKFDFIEVDSGDVSSHRSTTWAGNDLPDLFLYGNPVSEQVIYSQYGAIVPMNDDNLTAPGAGQVGSLLQYMPNYSKKLDENFGLSEDTAGSAKQLATMPDGKMYSVVCSDNIPHNLTYKMYVNTKWIDNLNSAYGLNLTKEPQTVDEYLTILRAFKRYDANANGKADDEIPASAADLQYLRNFIMAAHGYVTTSLELDGDEYVYVPSTEAYREYLKVMRTMYSEGLIDQSTFEMSEAQLVTKGQAGLLGSFPAPGAYTIVGKNREAEYDSIGPLTSASSNKKLQWALPNFEANGSMIPTGTPYVREIARLLDIFYTEYGAQLSTYGVEGENFSWNDEAKSAWTFNIPDSFTGSDEEYRASISPQPFLGAHLYLSNDFMSKDSNPIVQKIIKQAEKYAPYLKSYSVENVKLSASEYTDMVAITSNLESYIKTVEYSFIAGTKNPNSDADWNAFQSELNGYKYQSLTSAYTTAYQKG